MEAPVRRSALVAAARADFNRWPLDARDVAGQRLHARDLRQFRVHIRGAHGEGRGRRDQIADLAQERLIGGRVVRLAAPGSSAVKTLIENRGAGTGRGEPLHLLGSHGQANCLIIIPADATNVAPGQVVDVMFLSNRF